MISHKPFAQTVFLKYLCILLKYKKRDEGYKKKKKLFQVPHLAPTQDFELKGIYSADKDVYLTSEPTVYCVILQ